MIYVDPLRPTARTKRWRHDSSCHMMADTSEELDAFARRIGLKRCWRDSDHYDLTAPRRAAAVTCGALEVASLFLVNLRRKARGQAPLVRR